MFGAPPWAADPWRPEPSLVQLAGAAVPFPWRKATPGFLPAWQELQRREPWRATPREPPAAPTGPTGATGGPTGGLVFPGELRDEKQRRRLQQQEMQSALDEQIREQRLRKQPKEVFEPLPQVEVGGLFCGSACGRREANANGSGCNSRSCSARWPHRPGE